MSTQTLYSSTYDVGEMWVSRPINPDACGCSGDLGQGFGPLYLDTTGPAMTVRVAYVGNAGNFRYVETFLNNSLISTEEMDYYADSIVVVKNIPANFIKDDNATFFMRDSSSNIYDEIRVNKVELSYPHLFDFENDSTYTFQLPPAPNKGRLIKITDFNAGTATPILYDILNGKRYVGDVSVPGTIQFLLEPSSINYNLVLVRGDGSTATTVTSLTKENFVDFTQSANQGNYLIISNPRIYGSGSTNYVAQYQAYRASQAGGSYNSKVIDINQLVDQFAYGVKQHPLSIKSFLQYARGNFSVPPAYVFLIGKGVTYNYYNYNQTDPLDDQIALVPTWGYPGSDNLLSSKDYTAIPTTPIGRLSAVSAEEVGDYFNKIKQYEAAQQDTVQTFASKGWMKNVLQLVGADDPTTGAILDGYMKTYKKIISDTLFGANVISYSKTANPSAYPEEIANFVNTFDKGSAIVNYFGHSSSTNLDFNLSDPSSYNNTGKYPLFIVNGCLAGNIFDYDPNRLTLQSTVSEKFVLQPSGELQVTWLQVILEYLIILPCLPLNFIMP